LKLPHREHRTEEESHGRHEERHYVLAKLPDDFLLKAQWPGAKAVGMAVRIAHQRDGQMSCDVRYFLSSRFLSGRRFAEAVRGHWSIENSLHWVLDVSFGEDQSRTRHRRLADNLSWLRRFAISLLKQHPYKQSIVIKSRMASRNTDFLTEVLAAKGV
jgi:predicted transposase YbfD/YdcC